MHAHDFYNRRGIDRRKDGNRLGLRARKTIYQLTARPAFSSPDSPPSEAETTDAAAREVTSAKRQAAERQLTGMEMFLSSKLATQESQNDGAQPIKNPLFSRG